MKNRILIGMLERWFIVIWRRERRQVDGCEVGVDSPGPDSEDGEEGTSPKCQLVEPFLALGAVCPA